MKIRTKVRWGVFVFACFAANPTLSEESAEEMSFLEFLGMTVNDGGELVDPLTLYEDAQTKKDGKEKPDPIDVEDEAEVAQ